MEEILTNQLRQKVLVADDSEMNRMLLEEMLGDKLDLVEVENGREAVEVLAERAQEFSLLLLDIMMPEMDGFEVLDYMNRYHWIEDVPVIIISAENSPSYIERAYDLGVTDFINRPFDAAIVRRRVENTLLLSAKQRRLTGIVADQIFAREKTNRLMINILSHIVEFRNGESGAHVVHISTISDMLLRELVSRGSQYDLDPEVIGRITMASALHDVGKISIPDSILNKPGKLTDEEYAIMKTHAAIGAEMLNALPEDQRADPLVQTAYEICRWHHERYDGRGYPDGLKGEEIPISAQVVSLADVYDALTSERVYKPPFTHEKAISMILDGQCGAFNPELLDCLLSLGDRLPEAMKSNASQDHTRDESRVAEAFRSVELSSTERMVQQLNFERKRFQFMSNVSSVMMVTYLTSPPSMQLNRTAAKRLGVRDNIMDPLENPDLLAAIEEGTIDKIGAALHAATPEAPDFEIEIRVRLDGEFQSCLFRGHAIWFTDEAESYTGLVARIKDLAE